MPRKGKTSQSEDQRSQVDEETKKLIAEKKITIEAIKSLRNRQKIVDERRMNLIKHREKILIEARKEEERQKAATSSNKPKQQDANEIFKEIHRNVANIRAQTSLIQQVLEDDFMSQGDSKVLRMQCTTNGPQSSKLLSPDSSDELKLLNIMIEKFSVSSGQQSSNSGTVDITFENGAMSTDLQSSRTGAVNPKF